MQERRHERQPPADPSGIEAPHDVLAAEEFGIGTRDERFPADPTGNPKPHDVLAAEEFAMPSEADAAPHERSSFDPRSLVPLLLLAALVALVVVRRRS
jgi:MYXO-CTERM domain-containing protein